MQSNRQLLVRSLRETLFARSLAPASSYSLRSPSGSRHGIHLSRSHQQSNIPTFTASEAQVSETPLKVTSASGSTPSSEDPEDSRDHDHSAFSDPATTGSRIASGDSFARQNHRFRGRTRGSSSRRALKSDRTRKISLSKTEIPEWFTSRNITLCEDLDRLDSLQRSPPLEPSSSSPESTSSVGLAPSIRTELEAHLSAALVVRPGGPRYSVAARKAHLYLQCPKRAIYFLDEIIENSAKELKADIIRLDSQDLEELLEDVVDPTMPELGFPHPQIVFTNFVRDQSKDLEQKEELNSEENEEIEEDEEISDETNGFRLPPDMPLRLFRLFSPRSIYPSMMSSNSGNPRSSSSSMSKEDTDSKVVAYLNNLLSVPASKRSLTKNHTQLFEAESKVKGVPKRTSRTIVYLRDFQSILDSPRGQIAHQSLLNIIQNRRRLGEQIMLVVSDDLSGENIAPVALSNQYYHIIKVPPPNGELEKSKVEDDGKARTREINLRSLQSAIRQRSGASSIAFDCPVGIHLDPTATSSIPDLDKEIWEASKIQRIASVVVGHHGRWLEQNSPEKSVPITLLNIAQAVSNVLKADQARAHRKQENNMAREAPELPKETGDAKSDLSILSPIKSKDCNKHEQKLLGGVIDPGIRK